MLSLPAELDKQCSLVLVQCDEFDSTGKLRAVFVTAELAPFANGLPERTDSKRNFVNAVKLFLLEKRLADKRVLMLPFLDTLRGYYPEQDALHGDLSDLYQRILVLPGAGGQPRTPAQPHVLAQASTGPGREITPTQLLEVLSGAFNMTELNSLCFDMGIEFEDIEGSTRQAKAQALLQYCQRLGRFPELVQHVRQLRPHAI